MVQKNRKEPSHSQRGSERLKRPKPIHTQYQKAKSFEIIQTQKQSSQMHMHSSSAIPIKLQSFSMASIVEQFENEDISLKSPEAIKKSSQTTFNSGKSDPAINCSPTSNNTNETPSSGNNQDNIPITQRHHYLQHEENDVQRAFLFNNEDQQEVELSDSSNQISSNSSSNTSSNQSDDLYDSENAPFFHKRMLEVKQRRYGSMNIEEGQKERRHYSVTMDKLSSVSIIQSHENTNPKGFDQRFKRRGSVKSYAHRKTSNDLFNKKRDIGSPVPENQILLPFQRVRRSSLNNKQGSAQCAKQFPHLRKLSDSSIPFELMLKTEDPMKASVYKNMTLHIFHTVNIIKQIKDIPDIEEERKINFTFRKPGMKKLIIFDLDETLIHCQREQPPDQDTQNCEIRESDGSDLDTTIPFKFVPDIWLDILDTSTDELDKIGFSIRPFAIDCLKKANQNYEVAIFTAGNDWYANPIIDYLDPTGELIQHRLFRHDCTFLEKQGFYVKDLRIFNGIDLKDVIIVDNYVYSFALHLENGIPIVPFEGQKDDLELIKVMRYISWISDRHDLRIANEQVFQLKKIFNSKIENFIKYYSFDVISDIEERDSSQEGSTPKEKEIQSISEESLNESQSSQEKHDNKKFSYINRGNLRVIEAKEGFKEEIQSALLKLTPDNGIKFQRVPITRQSSKISSTLLSGSFKQSRYKRDNSFHVGGNRKRTPFLLYNNKNYKSSLNVSSQILHYIPNYKGSSATGEEPPSSTIKPPKWNRGRQQSRLNSKGDTKNSRPPSVVSKDIDEDLSKWQDAYQRICQNGTIFDFFRQSKVKDGSNSKFLKHLSFPVGNVARLNKIEQLTVNGLKVNQMDGFSQQKLSNAQKTQ